MICSCCLPRYICSPVAFACYDLLFALLRFASLSLLFSSCRILMYIYVVCCLLLPPVAGRCLCVCFLVFDWSLHQDVRRADGASRQGSAAARSRQGMTHAKVEAHHFFPRDSSFEELHTISKSKLILGKISLAYNIACAQSRLLNDGVTRRFQDSLAQIGCFLFLAGPYCSQVYMSREAARGCSLRGKIGLRYRGDFGEAN